MAVEVGFCGGSAVPVLSFRTTPVIVPYLRASYQSWNTARKLITFATLKRNPKRLKYSAPRFTKEDGLMYVEVDPSGSDSWKLDPVIGILKEGAVGVIPTDTVYAIVCDLRNLSAIERLRRDIDTYTTGFPRGNGQGFTNIFRAVKHCLPGPYTFILTASKDLPKQCIKHGTATSKYASRKKVGVRIPDDAVCQAILEKMDSPLISTSVKSPKDNEWILDPVLIADVYRPEGLDFVVDAGMRVAEPSTVVDMTGSFPHVLRLGKGPRQPWMAAEDEDSPLNEDALIP